MKSNETILFGLKFNKYFITVTFVPLFYSEAFSQGPTPPAFKSCTRNKKTEHVTKAVYMKVLNSN